MNRFRRLPPFLAALAAAGNRARVLALAAALCLLGLTPSGALAQEAAPPDVVYTPVVNFAQLATLVQTNGGKAMIAAFGVAISFFVARKLVRWLFGAV